MRQKQNQDSYREKSKKKKKQSYAARRESIKKPSLDEIDKSQETCNSYISADIFVQSNKHVRITVQGQPVVAAA